MESSALTLFRGGIESDSPRRWTCAAPALAVGQAIGRIGCQLAGDGDWGLPSTLPWAMAYPRAIIGWNSETVLKLDEHYRLVSGFFPGVRVHPAPVYETILYLGVFAILWSMRKTSHPAGRLMYWYLVLAGAARFLVEFVRINPRVFHGLSEAQLIAIAMMIVGGVALILTREKDSAESGHQPGEKEPASGDERGAGLSAMEIKDKLLYLVAAIVVVAGIALVALSGHRGARIGLERTSPETAGQIRGDGGGRQSSGRFQAGDPGRNNCLARIAARQSRISERMGYVVRTVPGRNALDADAVRRLQGQQGLRDAGGQPGHQRPLGGGVAMSRRTGTISQYCSTPKTRSARLTT